MPGRLPLAHWYHAWCDGPGTDAAVDEHFTALHASRIRLHSLHVVLVGSRENRSQVRARLPRPCFVYEDDSGWEQRTLDRVAAYARCNDGLVMYAHSKGASDPSDINIAWRRSMTQALVMRHDDISDAFTRHTSLKLATTSWLIPAHYPPLVTSPFPAGNFWWARTSYLATLPSPVPSSTRHDAESWLGSPLPPYLPPNSDPSTHELLDLAPRPFAWPGFDNFHPPTYLPLTSPHPLPSTLT